MRHLVTQFWQSGLASTAVARGVSLFVGAFCLLNLAGDILHPGFDANEWWIDLRWLPHGVSLALLSVAGVLLLGNGLLPDLGSWQRRATLACTLILTVALIVDSVQYYLLLWRGLITSTVPIPCTALLALSLGLVGWEARRPRRLELHSFTVWPGLATCFLFCLCFPLLQM